MPDQLSVHRNPGRNKGAIPYLVTVQSNRFRDAARRVVVPLYQPPLMLTHEEWVNGGWYES